MTVSLTPLGDGVLKPKPKDAMASAAPFIREQNDWREPRFIATVPGRGSRFLPTFGPSEAAGEPS